MPLYGQGQDLWEQDGSLEPILDLSFNHFRKLEGASRLVLHRREGYLSLALSSIDLLAVSTARSKEGPASRSSSSSWMPLNFIASVRVARYILRISILRLGKALTDKLNGLEISRKLMGKTELKTITQACDWNEAIPIRRPPITRNCVQFGSLVVLFQATLQNLTAPGHCSLSDSANFQELQACYYRLVI